VVGDKQSETIEVKKPVARGHVEQAAGAVDNDGNDDIKADRSSDDHKVPIRAPLEDPQENHELEEWEEQESKLGDESKELMVDDESGQLAIHLLENPPERQAVDNANDGTIPDVIPQSVVRSRRSRSVRTATCFEPSLTKKARRLFTPRRFI